VRLLLDIRRVTNRDRRELVWIAVTRNPTAASVARQITEAFPWEEAPGDMIRDRGVAFMPASGGWVTHGH